MRISIVLVLVLALCSGVDCAGDDAVASKSTLSPEAQQLKALYFALYAAFGVLSPYLSLFFQNRAISKPWAGVLMAIPNAACVLCGPMLSAWADSTSNHWSVLFGSIVAGAMTTLIMLFIPEGQIAWMMLLVVAGSIARSPTTSIVDTLVIRAVGAENFGDMRLYGAASFGILSLVGGLLLSSGFTSIFLTNVACCGLASLVVLRLQARDRAKAAQTSPYDALAQGSAHPALEIEMTQTKEVGVSDSLPSGTSTSVYSLLKAKFDEMWGSILIFFCIVTISGISDGIIDAFLFVRVKELGGSGALLGIARALTCVSEVLVFPASGKIYDKLGVWNCLAVTSVAFVIRFCAYCFLTPSTVTFVLAVECLNGLTFALTWQTSCKYASEIAPKGTDATAQSILESLHWGLGSGAGAFLSGFVYHYKGAQYLFVLAAALSAASFFLSLVGALFFGGPASGQTVAELASQAQGSIKNPVVFSIVGDEEEVEVGLEEIEFATKL